MNRIRPENGRPAQASNVETGGPVSRSIADLSESHFQALKWARSLPTDLGALRSRWAQG